MNLITLINLWLNINYQITTKCATVSKPNFFSPTKHPLMHPHRLLLFNTGPTVCSVYHATPDSPRYCTCLHTNQSASSIGSHKKEHAWDRAEANADRKGCSRLAGASATRGEGAGGVGIREETTSCWCRIRGPSRHTVLWRCPIQRTPYHHLN